MDERLEIRHKVLVEGVSKREILRQKKMHWRTLEKILSNSVAPGYARQRVALTNQNVRLAGFRVAMLRKLADDGRRPKANREIPVVTWCGEY